MTLFPNWGVSKFPTSYGKPLSLPNDSSPVGYRRRSPPAL